MNNSIRIEMWNDHQIRFVEVDSGEWWAILADIADALELSAREVKRRLPADAVSTHMVDSGSGHRLMLIVNEYGIYDAVFQSRKREAREFRRWVYRMLKTLRQASGLEGFQVFRMLDKEHQREAMAKLNVALRQPVRVDFIKANTIANKTVSTMFGYPKLVKKSDMSPEMLVKRQDVLDDTVELMTTVDKFGLPLSVSETVYSKYLQ